MDDPTPSPFNEFDIRVRTRLRDPIDEQPCSCEGTCSDGSEARPETCKEGSIALLPDARGPDNGVMEMRTQAAGKRSATSVAAKGAFARAGDEGITVAFEYQFCGNADAELAVYLSDAAEVSEHLVEVVRLSPPATGPGSIGSDAYAEFRRTFPRGSLDFTRGTYVELELRGADACVRIDNFDPAVVTDCGAFPALCQRSIDSGDSEPVPGPAPRCGNLAAVELFAMLGGLALIPRRGRSLVRASRSGCS